ncbi:MAG TPA: hypothetical protein PK941_12935 [Paludibacter sp.]|nr:hypothetical protein [Paludibacter sp.]
MMKPKFSKWISWSERDKLSGIKYPGIYALAVSEKDLSNTQYTLIEEIKYFGITNSGGGLKSRLKQFDNTIIGKSGHGGAERFLYKYKKHRNFAPKLFVSVCPVVCDVKSNNPKDLLIMGEIAWLEYYCFAEYKKRFKKLPLFNDKIKSSKLKYKR